VRKRLARPRHQKLRRIDMNDRSFLQNPRIAMCPPLYPVPSRLTHASICSLHPSRLFSILPRTRFGRFSLSHPISFLRLCRLRAASLGQGIDCRSIRAAFSLRATPLRPRHYDRRVIHGGGHSPRLFRVHTSLKLNSPGPDIFVPLFEVPDLGLFKGRLILEASFLDIKNKHE